MADPALAKTEIVRASELQERVLGKIAEIRDPDSFADYEKELRRYKRRLGKREEVVRQVPVGGFFARQAWGFVAEVYDQEVFVPRPERPRPCAYSYHHYSQSTGLHAAVHGLLADARCNRDLRPQRVDEYREAMERGEWRDLLSDPIAITAEGDVLNGQHRLAAADGVDWSEVDGDPAFLVIWDADPEEALHADGSRRTARDEKIIASRLLSGDRAARAEQDRQDV